MSLLVKHNQMSAQDEIQSRPKKRVNVYFNSIADFEYVKEAAQRHSMKVPRYLLHLALAMPLSNTADARLTNQLANISNALNRALNDPEHANGWIEDALSRVQTLLEESVRDTERLNPRTNAS